MNRPLPRATALDARNTPATPDPLARLDRLEARVVALEDRLACGAWPFGREANAGPDAADVARTDAVRWVASARRRLHPPPRRHPDVPKAI